MRFKYSAEFLHWLVLALFQKSEICFRDEVPSLYVLHLPSIDPLSSILLPLFILSFFNLKSRVLKHPGYRPEWHLGVRVTSSRKLVAFISGIPHELRVRETSYHSTEINFLCVHKKLRSKRLAPVLIKEVTRQCNLTGIFQAIYTGGIVLPTPISCARYYHRTINPAKLVAVEFAAVPKHMSREAYFKRFDLPEKTKLKGLREMEVKDVGMVGKLMRRYMKRFDMAPRFSDEEIKHLFLSGRGEGEVDAKTGARQKQVTWTYVVEVSNSMRRRNWSFDLQSFFASSLFLSSTFVRSLIPSLLSPPSKFFRFVRTQKQRSLPICLLSILFHHQS